MAINTETVATRLAERLAEFGVELTDAEGFATAFAGDLVEWVGGTEAVPVALASKVSTTATAWNTDVMERIEWWTGSVDGGPNGDGLYPMTNAAGVTTLFPSLAKILDSTAKGNAGWSPKLTSEADGPTRVVWRVTDWTGGQGAKPATGYIAADGSVVGTAAAAYDFFGVISTTLAGLKTGAETARDQTAADLASTQGLFNAAADILPVHLAAETGYVWALIDPVTKRAAAAVQLDGTVLLPKLVVGANNLGAGIVGSAALGAGAVTAAKILDGEIDYAKLSAVLNSVIGKQLATESGYSWALIDPVTKRAALAITLDGTVMAPKFQLAASAVAFSNLAADVTSLMPVNLPVETGYVWALMDPVTKRAAIAVTVNGSVIANVQVGLANLALPVSKLVKPTDSDRVRVFPDGVRSIDAAIGVVTDISGNGWAQFPARPSPSVRGVNGSGATLQFRRSVGLKIRGRRRVGSYDPTAGGAQGVAYKGDMTLTSTWPPSGTFVDGDYYRYVSASGQSGTRTIGADIFHIGDLAVRNSGAWARQAAPFSSDTDVDGDWAEVTAAGVYDGLTLAVGDRVVMSGGRYWKRYLRGRPELGEHFLVGDYSPAGALPASPRDGDLYTVSAAGTQGGLTFAQDDYLVRWGGVWGVVPCNPVTAVASGALVHLPCQRDASEWEVRRADKGAFTTRVGLVADTQTSKRWGANSDDLVMYADSMGNYLSTAAVSAFSPRSWANRSISSAPSQEILGEFQYDVRAGDPYSGRIHMFWTGQNNETAPETTLAAAERFASQLGVREPRFVIMSVLGRRQMTFNGSRIVVDQQEDQFNRYSGGVNKLAKLLDWYEQRFPGQWFDTRTRLAAAVTSTLPDLTFPGMTEAQVAATYGALPVSWYFDYSAVPWAPGSLVFQGYRAAAGLPTGGVANDYYVRTANGVVGNLLVNEAGIWVERTADSGAWTHMLSNGQGNATLATLLKTFIQTEKGW